MDVETTDTKAGRPSVKAGWPDAEVDPPCSTATIQPLGRAMDQAVESPFSTANSATCVSFTSTDLTGYRITPVGDASGGGSHFVTAERDAYATRTEAAMRLNTMLELQSARIAGLLHDEASQVLASAQMAIGDIAHDVPSAVQARLHQVKVQLEEVAEQLRRVSYDLHPTRLDVLGLAETIRFIARAFTRRTGVQLAIEAHLDEPCSATVGAIVHRFTHEALTNIGEHAHATSASITLGREGSRLVCAICDDGVGFDVAAALARDGDQGRGLRLIRDRVEAAGGTLEIASIPQQGSRLHAVIPLEI